MSSFVEICEYVNEKGVRSISFDIDGTLYSGRKIQLRWWKALLYTPVKALRYLKLKAHQKKSPEEIIFVEEFLAGMLDESLVPFEIVDWIKELNACEVQAYFLSAQGAMSKLKRLGLAHTGKAVNCPHEETSTILRVKFGIDPKNHLHLGAHRTNEEQAKLFGCEFRYFRPEELFR